MTVAPIERDIEALLRFIEARAIMPHAWGRRGNDCVSFVVSAVQVETGIDRAKGLRWSTEAGALLLIERLGGLEAAFDARFRRIEPAQAMRGDVGAIACPLLGLHPMILEGPTLVGPTPRGQRRVKRRMMIAAWSAT